MSLAVLGFVFACSSISIKLLDCRTALQQTAECCSPALSTHSVLPQVAKYRQICFYQPSTIINLARIYVCIVEKIALINAWGHGNAHETQLRCKPSQTAAQIKMRDAPWHWLSVKEKLSTLYLVILWVLPRCQRWVKVKSTNYKSILWLCWASWFNIISSLLSKSKSYP